MPGRCTPREVFDGVLALLESLTAISSPTGDDEGLTRCAELLGSALEARGMTSRIEPQLVLIAGATETMPARPLLLVGHLDTVLPAGAVARRPERGGGGRLYATGAADMKGGLAALVGALDLLRARDLAPPADLVLAVVPDEEVMGPLTVATMRDLGAAARGVWVLEPGRHAGGTQDAETRGAETLVGARRGLVHWRLDVAGRGAHAGNDFWHGRSALVAAAAWAVGAAGLARPGDGPTVSCGRLIAGEAAFAGTARQLNVVPDRALVEGEARFLTAVEGTRLLRALDRLAERVGAEHEVEARFSHRPPIPPLEPHPEGRRWAERAVAIAAEQGWPLEIEKNRGGLSFPNCLPDPTAVPVLDGLGPAGGGLHTREEYVDLTSLDRRIALLAELLARDAAGSL